MNDRVKRVIVEAAVITTFGSKSVLLSHYNFHSDDIFNKKVALIT